MALAVSGESVGARLTRQSGTNFYYAFRILPEPKRQAIYALYSFCRVVDDCVDEADGEGEPGLRRWLEEAHRAYAGTATTSLGRELAEAVSRFPIPRTCFDHIVEGCRMDLSITRYAAFSDLRAYCERVASAVGLASIEIFGYTDERAREYAVELGLALQLTNILRDIVTDAERGRLYIPVEDLLRFGVTEKILVGAGDDLRTRPPGVQALLAFQAERARTHYARARATLPQVDRRSLVPAEIMGGVYRALLEEMARRGFPLQQRVRVSRPRKLWIVARILLGTGRPS
jgi:15-cis-phytoene synthase